MHTLCQLCCHVVPSFYGLHKTSDRTTQSLSPAWRHGLSLASKKCWLLKLTQRLNAAQHWVTKHCVTDRRDPWGKFVWSFTLQRVLIGYVLYIFPSLAGFLSASCCGLPKWKMIKDEVIRPQWKSPSSSSSPKMTSFQREQAFLHSSLTFGYV